MKIADGREYLHEEVHRLIIEKSALMGTQRASIIEQMSDRVAGAELERHVEVSGGLDGVEPLDDVLVVLLAQAGHLALQELYVFLLASQLRTALLTLNLHGHQTPEQNTRATHFRLKYSRLYCAV